MSGGDSLSRVEEAVYTDAEELSFDMNGRHDSQRDEDSGTSVLL